MITKSDILPSLVAVVSVVSLANPNGMLEQWRESLHSSLSPKQIRSGEFTMTIPPSWEFHENALILSDGTNCEVRQSPKTPQTMSRLLAVLQQKYPKLKVVENTTHQVLVLNQEKTIVIFEGAQEYLLITVPLSHVSELLKGFSLGSPQNAQTGTPQPVAL
jgi:hypothetical protein